MKVIGIETRRYSNVVRAFLDRYPDAIVRINRKIEKRPTDEWCTNEELKETIDFSLSLGNRDILSFHDHPNQLIASEDQTELVQELEGKKILRIRMLGEAPTLTQKLFGRK